MLRTCRFRPPKNPVGLPYSHVSFKQKATREFSRECYKRVGIELLTYMGQRRVRALKQLNCLHDPFLDCQAVFSKVSA